MQEITNLNMSGAGGAAAPARAINRSFSPVPAKSQFLSGFTGKDLEVILSEARPHHFPRHAIITRQDAPADQLYLLTKGRARFFFTTPEGHKILLLWLTPGEIFGASTLLEPRMPYLVGTEALKDSSTLTWDRITLRRLVTHYPRLMHNALFLGHKYLTWYVADHSALVTASARQRLARVIMCLAEGIGERSGEHVEIEATNEELATAANITAFTTSRILREWRQRGAIAKRRARIVLLSKQRLCDLSRGEE